MTIKKLVVEPLLVEWDDSTSCYAEKPQEMYRINLAFLICEDSESLVLSKEIQNGKYIDFIRILKCQIKKVTKLDQYGPTKSRIVEAVPPR